MKKYLTLIKKPSEEINKDMRRYLKATRINDM